MDELIAEGREVLLHKTEAEWLAARCQDVTSTDCSALFGLSPYKSPWSLWREKKSGQPAEVEPSERMIWGNRLERVIAEAAADSLGVTAQHLGRYVRIPDLRIGSSFDYYFEGDDGPEILECKNVDSLQFLRSWTVEDDGNIEAPLHIEIQVQHQLYVLGWKVAHICALVGGNDLKIVRREADPRFHAKIEAKVRAFWESIAGDVEPEPDMDQDADAVVAMFQDVLPGTYANMADDGALAQACEDYHEAAAREKAAKKDKSAAKARILQAIGDHEKVGADGFKISAGYVGETEVAFTRPGYRNLRVTERK